MPITKARINLGAVVARVHKTGKPVILEKGGIPVATIVDMDTLEDLYDALDMMNAREETKNEKNIKWEDVRAKYI